MIDWRALGLSFLVCAGGLACATLDAIPEGVCGNGIVEEHEDCDEADAKKCGVSTGDHPCRFLCAKDIACKEGWRCGVDGVCTEVAKPFEWAPPVLVPEGTATSVHIADFDGDGRGDVLAVVPPAVNVHFFDADGTSTTVASVIAPDALPAIGVLSTQVKDVKYPVHDFSATASNGVEVFRGSADRSLTPVVYASATFPSGLKIAGARYAPPSDVPATTALAYNETGVILVTGVAKTQPIASFAGETLQGNLLVHRLYDPPGIYCDQYVAAFTGMAPMPDYVRVYSVCDAAGEVQSPGVPGVMVALPPAAKICPGGAPDPHHPSLCRPLFAADVDHDGRDDLVIVAEGAEGLGLLVAYNVGDGHFRSDPAGPTDDKAKLYVPYKSSMPMSEVKGGAPLAVGFVNDDCSLDIVNDVGIYTSKSAVKAPCPAGQSQPMTAFDPPPFAEADHGWTDAAIVDMNHDGLPDVVVGSDKATGITLYAGTGTSLFNTFSLATSSSVNNFTIGDFDGDLLPDLAFAEIGEMDPDTHLTADSLSILFGGVAGGPTAPIVMAEIQGIQQILTTDQINILPDMISDLFVVTAGDGGMNDVAVFPGSSDRVLVGPYYLLDAGAVPDRPVRSVIAELNGDGHADLAVLGQKCDDTDKCTPQYWFIPSTGDAAIDQNTAVSGTLAGKAPFDTAKDALMVNIGKGGPGPEGTEQIAMIAPDGDIASVCVAGPSAGGSLGLTQGPKKIDGFKLTTAGRRVDGIAFAADVNGDGHDDVVLASRGGSLAVLLWDDAAGALDLDKPIVLSFVGLKVEGCDDGNMQPDPMDMGDLPLAAAPVQLGDGPTKSIVVIARSKSYVVSYEGGELVPVCHMEIPPGGSVAAGDLNGDGIADLVVGAKGGLRVLLGKTADAKEIAQ